jgi:uncharacterized protein involved in exopolysaccharide biosynthesis
VIPGKKYTPELLLSIAWRRKWLIVVPAMVIVTGVAVWTHRLKDVYRSDALIQIVPPRVPQNLVQSTGSRAGDRSGIEGRVHTISQQVLSRSRLEKIILDFDLYATARKNGIMEDIVEQMRTDIEGPTIIRGDAFRVGFLSENPRNAMRVTERLASLYIDESLRDREVLAEGTSQFLESQVEEARRQLIDNEKRLAEYGRQHDGQLPSQLQANLQGLHNTEMQLQSLEQSLGRDRDRRLVLERTLADTIASEGLEVAAPATREVRTRIDPTLDDAKTGDPRTEAFDFLVSTRVAPTLSGGGGGGGKTPGGGTGLIGGIGGRTTDRTPGFSGGGGGAGKTSGDASTDPKSGKDARTESDNAGSPGGPKGRVGSRSASAPVTAAEQLRAAQEAFRAMELRLTPEHPDIIRAKRAIAELQQRADAEASERPVSGDLDPAEAMRRNRLVEINAELAKLDKQIVDKTAIEKRVHEAQGTYQTRIEATPSRETELTELTRDYATLRTTYTNLLQKKLDAQVAANVERREIGETFKMLDPARLPGKPFSPNRPRYYGGGLLAAIAVGLALAFLLEYFDRTMRSENDVRAALNLPVLAAIPMIRVPSSRWRKRAVEFRVPGAAAVLATAAAIVWRLR